MSARKRGGNMPTPLLIAIILIVGCFTSAYATARICNNEFNSSWQVIAYTSSEVVVPKEIYICKSCYEKKDINYRYCPNCGAKMKNGIGYNHHSEKIDILS